MNKVLKITIITALLMFVFLIACSIDATSGLVLNTPDEELTNTDVPLSATTYQDSVSTSSDSTRVGTLSELPESALGFENILNILLITIGFILILLAIAILVRLKR